MNNEEKILLEENEVNEVPLTTEPAPVNVCIQCGAEVEDAAFCPHCGSAVLPAEPSDDEAEPTEAIAEEELASAEPVPDAIAQFNQGIVDKAEKKKKKTKLLFTLLIIAGAIITLFGAVFLAFNGRAEKVIKGIQAKNPATTVIQKDYDALTPVGQFLYRGKIVSAFTKQVKEKKYTPSNNSLVNGAALNDYRRFKKIADTLGLSEKHKVVQHIDAVLKLDYYEERYNGVSKCITASADSYVDCLDYISDAADYSSYYLIKLYVGYARSSAYSALSEAKAVSAGDELCTKYINALTTIEDELSELYYGYGYYSSYSVSAAMNTITELVSEISEVTDIINGIESSIPEL